MTSNVKLLSKPINFAVVQLPERQYPGVVIQGDTLAGIVERLDAMLVMLKSSDLGNLEEEIEEMGEMFNSAFSHYKHVCENEKE